MKLSISFLFVAVLVALSSVTWGQVVSLSSETPQRGEELTVMYDPAAGGTFSLTDPVYLYYRVMEESGYERTEVQRLRRQEGKLVGVFTIPQMASTLSLSFVSKGDWDYENGQNIQVVDADGNLYRNGYSGSVFRDQEAYQKELAAFPDNFAIYRTRWQILGMSNPEEGPDMIREEWAAIEAQPVRNAEYYHAQVTAHACLGEFETAIAGMEALMEKFPESPWVSDAHSFLNYMLFSKQALPQPELDEAMEVYLMSNPGSELAKSRIGSFVLGSSMENEALVDKISQAWLAKDPTLALMHLGAARVSDDRRQQLEHLSQAGNLFLNQEYAIRDGWSWDYLSSYLLPVIRTYLAAEAPAEALGMLAVLEQNTDQLESDYYNTVGAVWEALYQYEKALEAYILAADLGSEDGLESAETLYTRFFDPSGEGFATYQEETLAALLAAKEVPMAADFSVTDMDGNAVALSALRGKVVVLNFWFIGCAPCRIEMPGLNELVAEYADEEVVFVAFALDSQSSLENFLSKKEFDYTIIPESDEVAAAYGVQAYPTHVIIDAEGKVRSTLTGGSETRHEDLKPLIERLLR